jgi:hypothetical protein
MTPPFITMVVGWTILEDWWKEKSTSNFNQVFNFNKILLFVTFSCIFSTYKDSNVFAHFCGLFLNGSNLNMKG